MYSAFLSCSYFEVRRLEIGTPGFKKENEIRREEMSLQIAVSIRVDCEE